MTVVRIGTEDPLAVAAVTAIHGGELLALERLRAERPELATARLGDDEPDGMSRTLLHVVTDWPGHFPGGAAMVRALVPGGRRRQREVPRPHAETPRRGAASSDDVEVLDALIDCGADIEAPGAVIGGGPPLADARAFRNGRAASRLVERGADINWIPEWDALTPLDAAARSGSHTVLTWLHTHNAATASDRRSGGGEVSPGGRG